MTTTVTTLGPILARHEMDGIPVYRVDGSPGPVDATRFFDDVKASEAKQRGVLVDIRGLDHVGAEVRGVCYRRAPDFASYRCAVVGRSAMHRLLVAFMSVATGHRRTRYFVDVGEALEWLKKSQS